MTLSTYAAEQQEKWQKSCDRLEGPVREAMSQLKALWTVSVRGDEILLCYPADRADTVQCAMDVLFVALIQVEGVTARYVSAMSTYQPTSADPYASILQLAELREDGRAVALVNAQRQRFRALLDEARLPLSLPRDMAEHASRWTEHVAEELSKKDDFIGRLERAGETEWAADWRQARDHFASHLPDFVGAADREAG